MIHASLLTDVHAQPLVVVTDTLPGPPAAATVCDVGDAVKPQAPLWLTVTVWPATVKVPLRDAVAVFAATE